MKESLKRQLTGELASLIDEWLANLDDKLLDGIPWQPPDLAEMMAQQAVSVLVILDAGEQSLREQGALNED